MSAFYQPGARGHELCKEVRQLEKNQGERSMNFADKACPVVFRDSSMRQILAFEHPEAGLQIVKGSIEPGEEPRIAALRELAEESGITGTDIARDLGTWRSEHDEHVWSLQLCTY